MPNALTFVIGADSTPFATEMRKMNAIANNSARSIANSFASGHGAGMSGLLREAITIPREIIEGRGIGRILGSTSLLIQYMGNLASGTKTATAALEARALMLARTAELESLLGQKELAMAKAISEVKDIDLASTQAEVAALNKSALARLSNAEAATLERTAIEKDIAIKQAEVALAPKAGLGLFGVTVGVVLAVAAAFAAAYFAAKKYREMQEGIQYKDFNPQYIPKLEQSSSRIANFWRDIGRSIASVDDKYKSAAESAKRLADATEVAAQHQKTMDELAKETELAKAKTPEEKYAVEEKYSKLAQKRMHDAHDLAVKNREKEISELGKESNAKTREWRQLLNGVASEGRDRADVDLAKQKMETSAKAAEELEKEGWTHKAWDVVAAKYANPFGSWLDAGMDAVAIHAGILKSVKDDKAAYQNTVDAAGANADKRQQAEKLKKEIEAIKERAEILRKSGHNEDAKAYRAEAAFKQEELARLNLVKTRQDEHVGRGGAHESLNSLQRVGLGGRVASIAVDHLHAAQQTARHTATIAHAITHPRNAQHNPNGHSLIF